MESEVRTVWVGLLQDLQKVGCGVEKSMHSKEAQPLAGERERGGEGWRGESAGVAAMMMDGAGMGLAAEAIGD